MDYFKEREIATLQKLDTLLATLPPFCKHFFLGRELTTSSQTRLGYAYDLRLFFEFLGTHVDEFIGKPFHSFTHQDLEELTVLDIQLFLQFVSVRTQKSSKANLQNKILTNSHTGKQRKLASLRSFFAYLFAQDMITKNIMPKIEMPRIHAKPITRLDQKEISTLLEAPQLEKNEKVSIRDYTLLLFFLSTGLRVSELVGLNIGDINMKDKSFKVTRKGGEQVILFMTDELFGQVDEYFNHLHDNDMSIAKDMPLFRTRWNERIGTRSVQMLVKKYATDAVPLKNITPHKLRSTFGTRLYRKTGDIYMVADVLGHKDVNTTKKHYAAITDDICKEAIKKLDIHGE